MKILKPGPAAFTLIELLVVVSIISLLIAILLPALAKARAASQKTQCLANVRQFGAGAHMYTTDHQDYLLAHNWGSSSTTANLSSVVAVSYPCMRWYDILLTRYFNGNFSVLECPNQTATRHPTAYQPASPYPKRDYWTGYMVNEGVSSLVTARNLKLDDFRDPSRKIWYADTGVDHVGNNVFRPSSASSFADATGYRGVLSYRHLGAGNVVHFDGHGATYIPDDVVPRVSVYFSVNTAARALWGKYWDSDGDGNPNTPN